MKIIFKHLCILLFLGLIPSGCDDGVSPEEEHTKAKGFVLEGEGGGEVYRQFKGASSDTITIIVGETLELSVHFLDDDGNEIEHEEDEEDGLRISENDTAIAKIEVEEEEEEHHEMGIHIIGVSEGSTSFKLELMHGDHADFTPTKNVPITVNAQN
tara:strand:- start:623 stop:1090 length:468 start_codon:yes stop_codon:yes gene_type:complete